MSDASMSDRRPRYPIHLPLLHTPTAQSAPLDGVGWTWNLGEDGACVELAEFPPPRTSLDLHLHTDQGTLYVETRIAWATDAARARALGGGILHGVTFTRMAPGHRQALRDLLLAQCRERRTGVRFPLDLPVLAQPQGANASPFIRGRTGNLSRRGLMLRLPQSLSPSTILKVTLRAPRGPITTVGEIVWVDPGYRQTFGDPVRHGLRFSLVEWTGPLAMSRVLAELTSA
jgi:hypothetical protein